MTKARTQQQLKDIIRKLVYRIPRNRQLFLLTRTYADRYLGDNNSEFESDGELKLLQTALPKHGTPLIFDVGANVGSWTRAVLAHNPTAVVHCFEPSPVSFAELSAQTFPPQVVLNQIGLGDQREQRQFQVHADSVISSLYPGYIQRAPDRIVDVQIDTVDNYCAEHGIDRIDYLKIDVEGHDFAVLKGAAAMLSAGKVTYTHFEYGKYWVLARTFLRDVFAFADEVRCDLYKVMPAGLVHVPDYHLDLDKLKLSYFVLRPRQASP
jgi:FkbM family methyltransferase